jgi:hypothetical protein
MSAVVDLIPVTTISTESFIQTSDTIVDVSGYTEAAILTQTFAIDMAGDTTEIWLDTAIENRTGQWSEIGPLETFPSSPPPTVPLTSMKYLQGTTSNGVWTGFGRYLRIRVHQGPGASITFKVTALMKP